MRGFEGDGPHEDAARGGPGSRRRLLALTGGLAASVLAGCLGGKTGTGGPTATATPPPDDRGSAGSTQTEPDAATGLMDHPGATGLDAQPHKGPAPTEAEAVIIAFEDPSCPRCRAFERETVPKIESELVETGRAAYVFRGYPVVYPWGEPATQALESTFARDDAAFWSLAGLYFAEQPSFTSSNVLDRTRDFLAATTDLDADAVVSDAREKAHDAAVQTDLSAGMNAGVGRTTPTVLLFKDGRYVTRAAGSVSFSVIANALGL